LGGHKHYSLVITLLAVDFYSENESFKP
jgi:hypothetical protein